MYAQNSTSAINPGFCDINCCTSYWKAYFLILHFLLSISNVFPVIEMRLSFWIPPDNNYLCRLFEQNLIPIYSKCFSLLSDNYISLAIILFVSGDCLSRTFRQINISHLLQVWRLPNAAPEHNRTHIKLELIRGRWAGQNISVYVFVICTALVQA